MNAIRCLLRVWEELDLQDIEKYLIVVGELSAECFSCHKVGIGIKSNSCPYCGVNFKYVGFRRQLNMSFLNRYKEEFPKMVYIDFDDFKRAIGKRDAIKILDI